MSNEGGGGPSKKELKKLAKKAEKAAKKQQHHAEEAAAASASPEAVQTPAAVMEYSFALAKADPKDATSIKTVWASLLGDCALTAAPPAVAKNCTSATLVLLHNNNVSHQQLVSDDGNAMAQTVARTFLTEATTTGHFMEVHCVIDEWCEWERTCLGPALGGSKNSMALASALEHINHALQFHSPFHLVGSATTVADVCVVTCLGLSDAFQAALEEERAGAGGEGAVVPAAVSAYYAAHREAFEAAVEQTAELQKTSSSPALPEVDPDDPSLYKVLDALFRNCVFALYGSDALAALPAVIVKKCQDAKHGDYQCTAAMPLFGHLKKAGALPPGIKGPPQIATALVEATGTDHPILQDVAVQGGGFVVCRIRPSFLEKHVNSFLKAGRLPMPDTGPAQVCVVDFSSPNIAKEMHVGHLRSTIIGEAVCRILEAAGNKVHRVNHVGDWGTQFGMLIQYLKEEYPDFAGTEDKAQLPNITDLTVFYKSAKQRFDESEEFKEESRLNVVKLQSGDPECLHIWKVLCDVSRKEFEKVYQRLDITTEECGESFYNEMIPPVIEEFTQKGLISIEEGGAKCVHVDDKFQIPLMLQKSDGGFGYDSTDMAALRYRLFELKADRIIVITDFSQADHFKMIYLAGNKIGWVKEQRLEHIGFGTVQGEDGKRFKTRSGDTVRLVDLLDEAVSRMEASLRERIEAGSANITYADVHEVAEAIGYGAVKYFDLRRNPTSNYKFSYDNMLDTQGDTAVYLLYARVRLESICAKAEADYGISIEDLLKANETIQITHPSERNLAFKLLQFADIMTQTLDDLYPYHICEYVYKLATAASDFVTQCRVLGSPEMKSRLLLCYATATAMDECFDLLGIRHVKRI